jgi:histidinol-phosphatase (PHP family)
MSRSPYIGSGRRKGVIWEHLAEARRMIASSDIYQVFTHIDYAVRYWPTQQEGPFNPRIF